MNKMTRDEQRTGKRKNTHKLKMKRLIVVVVVVNGDKNETNTFSICHLLFYIYLRQKNAFYVLLDVETFS